jgi:hypothetical protein
VLVIERSATNTIFVTLKENVTISNPYYLFVLEGKSGQAIIKKILTDISEYPNRYQKFTFVEPTDIDIIDAGDYNYTFYQKTSNSTTILSTDVVLERGIARINNNGFTTNYPTLTQEVAIYETT